MQFPTFPFRVISQNYRVVADLFSNEFQLRDFECFRK